ncbi:MAG TPA: Lrp/AsnC family transcriptional regulator [Actinomycetales bacterium]|nr:Lrp/AsnC family transcriptional regulator [Actinomycetales bacterium]
MDDQVTVASAGSEAAEGRSAGRAAGPPAGPLDDVDRRILAELAADGRLSVRTLAERVHVSRTNAYARLERLVADGVITGFHAAVNPERAGLGTSAYVSMTVQQNSWREVSASLREVPYIDHFALVGADYDVLALVRAPDNSTLRDVVLDRIQGVPGVLSTRTWLVFEEVPGRGTPWAKTDG